MENNFDSLNTKINEVNKEIKDLMDLFVKSSNDYIMESYIIKEKIKSANFKLKVSKFYSYAFIGYYFSIIAILMTFLINPIIVAAFFVSVIPMHLLVINKIPMFNVSLNNSKLEKLREQLNILHLVHEREKENINKFTDKKIDKLRILENEKKTLDSILSSNYLENEDMEKEIFIAIKNKNEVPKVKSLRFR